MIFLLPFLPSGPSISDLNKLAQARDVGGLSKFVDNLSLGRNPLDVLKTNGAYECGKFGWNAVEMTSPSKKATYVVLSTPLTSEDNGEFLFERRAGRLHLIPEDDSLGVHIDRHELDVQFAIPTKSVTIIDRMSVHAKGDEDFVFRMSPEFEVSSLKTRFGKVVPFSQAGGIVILHKPTAGFETYVISYQAVVDRPLYSGSIGPQEATLTNCYWYPMVARQPVPYSVTAHYPSKWACIGQGVKTSESPGVTSYSMDLPCVFYSLSAGPYQIGSFSDSNRKFYAWSPRLPIPSLNTQAETYSSIIEFYQRFATFPFKTYGGLDSPGYGGGALEAYSYATYGGGFPTVDAHEPSHTWWGGILCNTYLHSFWNESFAVYSDELYHRSWTGTEGNRLAFIPRGGTNADYDRYACSTCGATCGPAASDLGYGKGSHVLYMLERLIGQPAMEKSMKRFISDHPPVKPAEWEDFEKSAEKVVPGRHLENFFQDWLDQPGHLEFSAKVAFVKSELVVDYRVKGKPMRVPLDVLIDFADGKHQNVVLDVRNSGIYRVTVPRKPSLVTLDPYQFLVRPIEESDAPLSLEANKSKLQVYVDSKHPDWAGDSGKSLDLVEGNPEGKFLVGSPQDWPILRRLFEKAGFTVAGDHLTYKGRTIDLNHGAAEAILDLGNGKTCGIGIGKTRISLEPGRARVGIFDDLGRLLDGEVSPMRSGHLSFRL